MENTDNTVQQPQEKINNYLVPAIISTLCCCLPLGIVAIVFAAQVNTKLSSGDVAGAKDCAGKAKMFTFIAVGLGLVGNAILACLQLLPMLIDA